MLRALSLLSRYHPQYPDSIDSELLIKQASDYFSFAPEYVKDLFFSYHEFHVKKRYEDQLGESRTLTFEEAFIILLASTIMKPSVFVEIGTQYGKSTRRIVDIMEFLNFDCSIICFDIIDLITYVSHDEITLVIHDLTNDFSKRVLEELSPSLIFLDAHPYKLLKNVISQFTEWTLTRPAMLAIHDCTPGLYNPYMKLLKGRSDNVSSKTGVWERHVLEEVFKTSQNNLDDLSTSTHRFRVFETTHGLGMLAPLRQLAENTL